MELDEYLALQNKRRKPHRMQEEQDQMSLVSWINMTYPDIIFTSALGGIKTTIGQAVKLKRLGYRKSWPDLFFAEPRKGFHGLFIELKSTGGKPSEGQKEMRINLISRGYACYVCEGESNAMAIIIDYFKP